MAKKDTAGKGSKKRLLKHLLLGLALVAAVILSINPILSLLTQHGRSIEVPDFVNCSFEEARSIAEAAGLRVVVTDTVFVRNIRKGVVFSQQPEAGRQVKNGRTIRLTTNADYARKVGVPDLVGLMKREAKAELQSKGLRIGRLIYVSDIATNKVMRQLYNNSDVKPGRKVDAGSYIDLVLGCDREHGTANVPNLVGLKYLRAVDAIHESSLNVGKLRFDSSVRTYSDSLNASVYKQSPISSGLPLSMGSEVTLYLK